ncbi:hypothetical protein KEJ39_03845 [Candidatus Bathyarchaeota archaeon]|nr:hypothetical protein [Candidatus Bathyarchaeota archaeon]
MSLLREKDGADVFIGGEAAKSSINLKSKPKDVKLEAAWLTVSTGFAVAALMIYQIGFGLTAATATFLAGPVLRLLLGTLRG